MERNEEHAPHDEQEHIHTQNETNAAFTIGRPCRHDTPCLRMGEANKEIKVVTLFDTVHRERESAGACTITRKVNSKRKL